MNQTQVPLGMPWRWHRRGVPTAFGRRTTPHPWPCPPPHDDSRPPLPSHAHAHGPAPSCKDADIGAPIEPAGTGPTSGPGCGLRDRAHARARVAGAGQRGVRCGTRLPKGQPSEHPQLRARERISRRLWPQRWVGPVRAALHFDSIAGGATHCIAPSAGLQGATTSLVLSLPTGPLRPAACPPEPCLPAPCRP